LKKGEKKDSIPDRQYPCLVRATVGKKTISTLVYFLFITKKNDLTFELNFITSIILGEPS